MIFGIDLGTTNSLIGSGDKLYSGLVASNVDVKQGACVGRDCVSEDVVSSYKTDMSSGPTGKLAVHCSTVVLKTLANQVKRCTGEEVKDVVISVPAYFSTSQREAVKKAASDAGLNVCALINEPTAAALYVLKKSSSLAVVYDLGGGTFDVSIVDCRCGFYKVVATDGLVIGGDDLDTAIRDFVVKDAGIPLRKCTKEAMKKLQVKARLAKEAIQKTGASAYIPLDDFGYETDYEFRPEDYKRLVKEVFGATIEMTLNLISKNVPISEEPDLIFVGGSTNCPVLKELVLDAVNLNEVKADYPDYMVARGVALYAEMIEKGTAFKTVEDVTKRLCISDVTGRGITIIESNTAIPCKASVTVSNAEVSDILRLELYQGAEAYVRDNEYVGTLIYNYDEVLPVGEGVVVVGVTVNQDGVIELSAYEPIYGEDTAISIKLMRDGA